MIEQFVLPVYRLIIEYSYLFLAILLIVKLFQLVSSFRNGGEGSSPWDPWGNKDRDGRDGNGRDRNGRDRDKDRDSRGGDSDDGRRIPDFTSQLTNLQNKLTAHQNGFQRLKTQGDYMLQKHYNHVNSGGYYGPSLPDIDPNDWTNLNNILTWLNNVEDQIDNIINNIRNHPDFSNITIKQLRLLTRISNNRSQQIVDAQNYYSDFIWRLNNDRPPAP